MPQAVVAAGIMEAHRVLVLVAVLGTTPAMATLQVLGVVLVPLRVVTDGRWF